MNGMVIILNLDQIKKAQIRFNEAKHAAVTKAAPRGPAMGITRKFNAMFTKATVVMILLKSRSFSLITRSKLTGPVDTWMYCPMTRMTSRDEPLLNSGPNIPIINSGNAMKSKNRGVASNKISFVAFLAVEESEVKSFLLYNVANLGATIVLTDIRMKLMRNAVRVAIPNTPTSALAPQMPSMNMGVQFMIRFIMDARNRGMLLPSNFPVLNIPLMPFSCGVARCHNIRPTRHETKDAKV